MPVAPSVVRPAECKLSYAENLDRNILSVLGSLVSVALLLWPIDPVFSYSQTPDPAPLTIAAYKLCEHVPDSTFVELLDALARNDPGIIVKNDIMVRYQIIVLQHTEDRSWTKKLKVHAIQLHLSGCVLPLPVISSAGHVAIATGILSVRFRDGLTAEEALKRLHEYKLEPFLKESSNPGPRYDVIDQDGNVSRLLISAASLQQSPDVIYAQPDMLQIMSRPLPR
jgi:hypothetical protein